MTELPPENPENTMKFSEEKLVQIADSYLPNATENEKHAKRSLSIAFDLLIKNGEGMDEESVKFLAQKLKERGFFMPDEIPNPNPKTGEESLAESYQHDTLLGDEIIEGPSEKHERRVHHTPTPKELERRRWWKD